jgi:hypothetical protein
VGRLSSKIVHETELSFKRNKGTAVIDYPLVFVGAPRRIRTSDIQIRSLTLYPAEPWAQNFLASNGGESGIRTRGTPLKGVQSLSRRSLSATQPSLRNSIFSISRFGPSGRCIWRREQDSNPRTFRSTVFKTAAIDHSAIPPHVFYVTPRRESCQHLPYKT